LKVLFKLEKNNKTHKESAT